MLRKNFLQSRRGRLTGFSLLYLSEGIPFGFSAVALTAYLRRQGVGLNEIGAFTAALYAPWAFKWAWAPLVDLIRPRRFGPSRTWIVLAQAMMIATMGLLLVVDVIHNLTLLTALVVVHNVFAATQDIAIDALAVRTLPESEMATANGFMFGSAYLGQAVGGSGALYVSGALGFQSAFGFILACMVSLLIIVSLRINEPTTTVAAAASRADLLALIVTRLREFARQLVQGFFRSGIGPLAGVVFALLPVGAMALGLALLTTLQVDVGMSEGQIANLSLMAALAGALGSVAGGWISDRLGHRRCLAAWYVLTTVPTFYLAFRIASNGGLDGISLAIFTAAAVSHSFFFGLQYGTSNAIFMRLSRPAVAATQFTGYMALHNLTYSYTSLWQGQFADLFGYARTLTLDGCLAFVPLLLLPLLKAPAREAEPT